MDSKTRSYLKSLASDQRPIFQIGKNEISEETIFQINNALEARELIKIKVLKNSQYNAEEAADIISESTSSEIVSTIGNTVILYRKSKKKNRI